MFGVLSKTSSVSESHRAATSRSRLEQCPRTAQDGLRRAGLEWRPLPGGPRTFPVSHLCRDVKNILVASNIIVYQSADKNYKEICVDKQRWKRAPAGRPNCRLRLEELTIRFTLQSSMTSREFAVCFGLVWRRRASAWSKQATKLLVCCALRPIQSS